MIYFGEARGDFDRFEIRPMVITNEIECEEAMVEELADFWSVYAVKSGSVPELTADVWECIADLETKDQAVALIKLLNSVRR